MTLSLSLFMGCSGVAKLLPMKLTQAVKITLCNNSCNVLTLITYTWPGVRQQCNATTRKQLKCYTCYGESIFMKPAAKIYLENRL